MKTTLELPDELVREIKFRALQEGKKLKEEFTDLLRKGLQAKAATPRRSQASPLTKHKKTGLPLVVCRHGAEPGQELTPDRVAQLLLEQEAGWQHDSGR